VLAQDRHGLPALHRERHAVERVACTAPEAAELTVAAAELLPQVADADRRRLAARKGLDHCLLDVRHVLLPVDYCTTRNGQRWAGASCEQLPGGYPDAGPVLAGPADR